MVDERKGEIEELDKKVDREKLLYEFKGKTKDIDFTKFISSTDMMDRIRDGGIRLIDAVNNRDYLLSELGEIEKGIQNTNQRLIKT